jgi:imidazolonepropionase-like amidohydrolase
MTLILRGGRVFDGTGSDPVEADVTVDDRHISDISQGAHTSVGGSEPQVIDVSGHTVLPGFIDAHTHLGAAVPLETLGQAGSISTAELAAAVFRNCELALDGGFTTCRETGGVDGGVVRAIARGAIRGPRILPSGPALAQDGGHATFMTEFSDCFCPLSIPGLSAFTAVVNGVDEVRLAARRAFRRGAKQLKVMVSGGVVSLTDSIDDTQLTIEEIRAAVVEAEARNTYVTAHSHNNRGIRNALTAGVKCIEHGSQLDEDTAALMHSAGAALIPTLAVLHIMAEHFSAWGLPVDVLDRMTGIEAGQERAIELGRSAGVTIGLGSDLLGPEQNQRGLEIVLRAQLVGALEALTSATSVNARILGIDDEVGTITAGKLADIIAVRGDPLEDPLLCADPANVVLVVKSGRVEKNLLA